MGWLRADPTAAVAPERIDRSRNLLPAPGLVAGALGNLNPELLAHLRAAWETANNRWNQWVLGYSRGQQFDLLRNLGMDSPRWEDLAMLLVGALSAIAAGGALWAWWDRRRVDPWVRQLERVRAALRAAGMVCAAHETPRALAQRAQAHFGDAAAAVVPLLLTLEVHRYSPAARRKPLESLTRQLAAQCRRLAPGSTR